MKSDSRTVRFIILSSKPVSPPPNLLFRPLFGDYMLDAVITQGLLYMVQLDCETE